jgi:hypothetical protein
MEIPTREGEEPYRKCPREGFGVRAFGRSLPIGVSLKTCSRSGGSAPLTELPACLRRMLARRLAIYLITDGRLSSIDGGLRCKVLLRPFMHLVFKVNAP